MHSPGRSESEDSIGTWEDGLRVIEEFDWGDPPVDCAADAAEEERCTGLSEDTQALQLPAALFSVSTGDADSRRYSFAIFEAHATDAETPATSYFSVPPETPVLEPSKIDTTPVNDDVGIPVPLDAAPASQVPERQLLTGLEEAAAATAPLGGGGLRATQHDKPLYEAMGMVDLPDLGDNLSPIPQGVTPAKDGRSGPTLTSPIQTKNISYPEETSLGDEPAGSNQAILHRLFDGNISETQPLTEAGIPSKEDSKAAISPAIHLTETTLSVSPVEDIETNNNYKVKPLTKDINLSCNGAALYDEADCYQRMIELKADDLKKLEPECETMMSKLEPEEISINVYPTAILLKVEEVAKDPFANMDKFSSSSASGSQARLDADHNTHVVYAHPSSKDGSDMDDTQHEAVGTTEPFCNIINGSFQEERAATLEIQPLPKTPTIEHVATPATVPVGALVNTDVGSDAHLPITVNTTGPLSSAETDVRLRMKALTPDSAMVDGLSSEVLSSVSLPPPADHDNPKSGLESVAGRTIFGGRGAMPASDEPDGPSSQHQHAGFSDSEDTRSLRAHRGSPANVFEVSDLPSGDTDDAKSDSEYEAALVPGSPAAMQSLANGQAEELAVPGARDAVLDSHITIPAAADTVVEAGASKGEASPALSTAPETGDPVVPPERPQKDQPSTLPPPPAPTDLVANSALPSSLQTLPHSLSEISPTPETTESEEAAAAPETEDVRAPHTPSSCPLQTMVAQPNAPASPILRAHEESRHDTSSELSDPPKEEEPPACPSTLAPTSTAAKLNDCSIAHVQYRKHGWVPVGDVSRKGIESLSEKRVTTIGQPKDKGAATQYKVNFAGRSRKYSRWVDADELNEVVPELVKQFDDDRAKKASGSLRISLNTGERRAAAPSSLKEPTSSQSLAPDTPASIKPSVKAKPRSKLGLKRNRSPKNPSSNRKNDKGYRPTASDSGEEPPQKKLKKVEKSLSGTKTAKSKSKVPRILLDGANENGPRTEVDEGEQYNAPDGNKDPSFHPFRSDLEPAIFQRSKRHPVCTETQVPVPTQLSTADLTAAPAVPDSSQRTRPSHDAEGSFPSSQPCSLTPSDLEVRYGKRETRSDNRTEKQNVASAVRATPVGTTKPVAAKTSQAKLSTGPAKRKGAPQGEMVSPSRKRQTRRVSELVEKEKNIGKRLRSATKG